MSEVHTGWLAGVQRPGIDVTAAGWPSPTSLLAMSLTTHSKAPRLPKIIAHPLKAVTAPANIPSVRVLVYGNDPLLLRTRVMVLEGAGLPILAAVADSEAQALLLRQGVGLVILCHSLSEAERSSFSEYVEKHRPTVPVLVLTARTAFPMEQIHGTILSIYEGPARLVQTVKSILAEETKAAYTRREA